VGPQSKVYEESPMSPTGLILRPVSVARVAHALGQNPDLGGNLEAMLDQLGKGVGNIEIFEVLQSLSRFITLRLPRY
jgi:hypothetical protein